MSARSAAGGAGPGEHRSFGLPPFANEPTLELRRGPVRESLLSALTELDARLPLSVPVLIGGSPGAADG
ncbi:MAG: hypothetical protein ACJ766_11080, partial [Thermoleophilaceae bacterium]